MPTTELLLRRARKALCRGSCACEARWTRSFLAGYALLGRDPAQTDENLYRYCFGAPTDGTDPSGLQEFPAPGQSPGGSSASLKARRRLRRLGHGGRPRQSCAGRSQRNRGSGSP